MKKYSASLLAVPLAASMLLAGCSGGAQAGSGSSPPTGSPPTTTTPTVSPPTTAVPGPKTGSSIPAAARAHTAAGAEAFVRHFFEELNVAWSKPQAGLISALSAPTCKTCANFEREAAKNTRVIGPSVILESVGVSGAGNATKMMVLAIGYQPKSIVIDAKGNTVQALKRERMRNLVTVQWDAVKWRIGEIQDIA